MKRSNKFSVIALAVFVVLTLAMVMLARRLSTNNDILPANSFKVENFNRLPIDQWPVDKNLPPVAPYFVDVSAETGLTGTPATEVCWVDTNDDGYWDVYLEREHLLISAAGKSFSKVETGFEFPIVKRVVPLHAARIDLSNVQKYRLIPDYVYFADVNNDGHVDALHGIRSDWEQDNEGTGWTTVEQCDHGYRNSIYLGDGTGHFQKQTPVTGSYDDPELFGPTFALAIADYDNDGCLDLFDGQNYRRYADLYGCGQDQLWIGNGTGVFRNATSEAGLETSSEPRLPNSSRPTYGATHGDINNDGFQDILQLAYGRQWNMHWRNGGDGTFQNVAAEDHLDGDDCRHGRYPVWWIDYAERSERRPWRPELPFRSNGNTMDAAVADYDNDGDLDVFLGEIKHEWAGPSSDLSSLLINRGAEGQFIFDRVSVSGFLPLREFYTNDLRKINFGDLHTAWLDFDNDGWLDLLIASGDYEDGQFLRLYRQLPDQRFVEATEYAGFRWEGCGGLSIGDYDRDGDIDILVGRSFARMSDEHRQRHLPGAERVAGLFQNRLCDNNGNHWLNLRLVGRGEGGSNRFGIGARAWVTTEDGITQMREIRCGSGLSGHQDPPEMHFGLGKHQSIKRLVIRWPNKTLTEQVYNDVRADQMMVVHEE